uniref:Biogenesis of lysosome-related organelles complex 1 subunit 7 n=1 Tax=Laticauda laticaudata TaxID=8630 RepID=A0A8C5RHP2_LATLA
MGTAIVFAEGLLEFLRPAVGQLDSHVHAVRESQVELAGCTSTSLAAELCRINEDQKVALDLDPYVNGVAQPRRRVVPGEQNILQNAQGSWQRTPHAPQKTTRFIEDKQFPRSAFVNLLQLPK